MCIKIISNKVYYWHKIFVMTLEQWHDIQHGGSSNHSPVKWLVLGVPPALWRQELHRNALTFTTIKRLRHQTANAGLIYNTHAWRPNSIQCKMILCFSLQSLYPYCTCLISIIMPQCFHPDFLCRPCVFIWMSLTMPTEWKQPLLVKMLYKVVAMVTVMLCISIGYFYGSRNWELPSLFKRKTRVLLRWLFVLRYWWWWWWWWWRQIAACKSRHRHH